MAAAATLSSVVDTQRFSFTEVTALLALSAEAYVSGGVLCRKAKLKVDAPLSVIFGSWDEVIDAGPPRKFQTYTFEYDYANEKIKVFVWIPGTDTGSKMEYDEWGAEQSPAVTDLPAGMTGITVRAIGSHDF